MNKLRLREVKKVNQRRSNECDVQMLVRRPSLVWGILLAGYACRKGVEWCIQTRARAVGTGEERPWAGSSITSLKKPPQTPIVVRTPLSASHSSLDISFTHLNTYSMVIIFNSVSSKIL